MSSTQLPEVNDGKHAFFVRAWGASTAPHPQYSFIQDLRTHNTIPSGGGMKYPTTQKWSGGTIDFEKLLVDAAAGTDLTKQKAAVTQISLAFNELLPCIPLWQRLGNNPINDKKRVAGWPDLNDKIFQNPGGDNFTIIMLMNGTLHSI